MPRTLGVLFAWASFLPLCLQGQQEAMMSLHCLSLQFQSASAPASGVSYSLDLGTGADSGTDSNGEVAPLLNGGPTTHGCRFRIQSSALAQPRTGDFFLNIPTISDSNSNGVNDFFEVRLPVNAATSRGAFVDDATGEQGSVSANWDRNANSLVGTCQLRLRSSYLNLSFSTIFSLKEFDGTFRFTPGMSNVTGVVSVANSPSNSLSGSMSLRRINGNSFALEGGSWTDSAGQVWSFLDSAPGELISPTLRSYTGFLDFADGDPRTSQADFRTWLLTLSNWQTAGGIAIPDLSYERGKLLPVLMLAHTNSQWWLSIHGRAGATVMLEQTWRLGNPQWKTIGSLELTNNLQAIQPQSPPSESCFWRVRTP